MYCAISRKLRVPACAQHVTLFQVQRRHHAKKSFFVRRLACDMTVHFNLFPAGNLRKRTNIYHAPVKNKTALSAVQLKLKPNPALPAFGSG